MQYLQDFQIMEAPSWSCSSGNYWLHDKIQRVLSTLKDGAYNNVYNSTDDGWKRSITHWIYHVPVVTIYYSIQKGRGYA